MGIIMVLLSFALSFLLLLVGFAPFLGRASTCDFGSNPRDGKKLRLLSNRRQTFPHLAEGHGFESIPAAAFFGFCSKHLGLEALLGHGRFQGHAKLVQRAGRPNAQRDSRATEARHPSELVPATLQNQIVGLVIQQVV